MQGHWHEKLSLWFIGVVWKFPDKCSVVALRLSPFWPGNDEGFYSLLYYYVKQKWQMSDMKILIAAKVCLLSVKFSTAAFTKKKSLCLLSHLIAQQIACINTIRFMLNYTSRLYLRIICLYCLFSRPMCW